MGQSDGIRRLIIGAPLVLVMSFCFGLFLVHPGSDGVDHSTAPEPSASKKAPVAASAAASTSQASHLPTLPTTGTTTTSTPAATDTSSSGSPATTPTTATAAASQPNGNSASKHPAAASNSDNAGHSELIQTVVNGLLNGH